MAGSPYFEAIRHGIAVVAAHTNFDKCSLEVVQTVSEGLKVKVMGRLFEEVFEQKQNIGKIEKGKGYGFWGEYPSPVPFSEVAKDVKSLFNVNGFWITDPPPSQIQRVGFVAGKGASFVDSAFSVQCDLFITGEVGYHNALSASRRGLAVMELGHRESEVFFVSTMKNWLSGLSLKVVENKLPIQKFWLGGTN